MHLYKNLANKMFILKINFKQRKILSNVALLPDIK